MILNAGNRPLSVENIPLDDIEKAFENDDVGCSSNSQLVADAPPNKHDSFDTNGIETIVLFLFVKMLVSQVFSILRLFELMPSTGALRRSSGNTH